MKFLNEIDGAHVLKQDANNRLVTDTEKTTWNNKANTDTVTSINGKTGVIVKADIVALGVPSADTNTTYSEISEAEITTGTASTLRTISARRLKFAMNNSKDTVTSINGKTGVIVKADIVALGVPAQDTVYTAGANISISPQNVISSTASDGGTGGAVDSVNGKTGVVTLNATEISLVAEPTSSVESALLNLSTSLNDKLDKNGGILENYTEKLLTTTGEIDLGLGSVFNCNAVNNTVFSITNAKPGVAHSFTLFITQGASVRTLTFPASVKWQNGVVPVLVNREKTYLLTFTTINGGATFYGVFGGEF